jgi:peptide/nickel transport system permease protein
MRIKYFVKRILIAIPTFFGITILVYFLASLAPGSPLDAFLADPRITEAELARKEIALGLDKPVIVQYYHWLVNLLHGDLGYSFTSQKAVIDLIGERIGATLLLAGCSILFSMLIALPLGVMAASKPKSKRDYASSFVSFFMMASPNFFVGLILIYFLSVKLKLLPSSGMYDSSGTKTIGMLLRHMILPCLVLSFQQIGNWFRQMRGSMLEVMTEEYIRTARAKGLGKWQVIRMYGLKNAFIPVLTVIGMSVPGLVGGAVVTEQLFGWQGLGTLMITAINGRDYPVIMGTTVVIALIVLGVNLLTDLAYGFLDPRISYQ